MSKSDRGFASMSKERVREIARKGGECAHAAGLAHTFTSEEAVAAGRKGGLKRAENRRARMAGLAAAAAGTITGS